MASIGRYVDLTLLGQGGMGAVYRGRDPELDRAVAIKVMLQATPDFVARFRREAQSIARLAHANIVSVYDFGVDGENNPYFVMELIDGTPLDELMRQRGRLPALDVVKLGRQAAEGLGAAHRAGIVHRDVKPSNLIVDGRGHLKLVDFGIARVADGGAQLTNAASLMGTPGYMAPEQAMGKKVDARADIYALGMTLFELLAGAPAFVADDPIALVVMNMQQPLPDLRQHAPDVPEELVQLVEMMAAKDPDARVQSCDAVANALSELELQLRRGVASHERRTDEGPAIAQGSAPRADAPAAIPPTNIGARPADDGAAAPSRTPMIVGAVVAVVVAGVIGVLVLARPKVVEPIPKTAQLLPEQPTQPAANPFPTKPRVDVPATGVTTTPTAAKADGPLRVAVLKFKNVGADASLAMLELGIGETAVNAMAQTKGDVTLVERSDIESDVGEIDRANDEHFDKATLAQKGQLEGVQVAVQGGFQRAGNKVRITARFVRVANGEIVDTLTVTRPVRDLFGAQDEVARGLSHKLLALAQAEKSK